jgi:hypothetical protein
MAFRQKIPIFFNYLFKLYKPRMALMGERHDFAVEKFIYFYYNQGEEKTWQKKT